MTLTLLAAAVTAALVWIAFYTAHEVADHWIQTDRQAQRKGLPGWPGRRTCAAHVATYTATTTLLVGIVVAVFGLSVSWQGFVAGQTLSAVTHYLIDRRAPLEWLVNRWPLRQMGKAEFHRLGMPREVAAYTDVVTIDDEDYEFRVYPETGPDSPPGWDNPSLGTGAYVLDQSWHKFWLFWAAIVTALI